MNDAPPPRPRETATAGDVVWSLLAAVMEVWHYLRHRVRARIGPPPARRVGRPEPTPGLTREPTPPPAASVSGAGAVLAEPAPCCGTLLQAVTDTGIAACRCGRRRIRITGWHTGNLTEPAAPAGRA